MMQEHETGLVTLEAGEPYHTVPICGREARAQQESTTKSRQRLSG
jgi:hypothetical protein